MLLWMMMFKVSNRILLELFSILVSIVICQSLNSSWYGTVNFFFLYIYSNSFKEASTSRVLFLILFENKLFKIILDIINTTTINTVANKVSITVDAFIFSNTTIALHLF